MACRRLIALVATLTAAGCGNQSLSNDASTYDGPTYDYEGDSRPMSDLFVNEVSSPGCEEHTAPVLDCVVSELACLTTNPCPSTWAEAQTTCPMDGRRELATACGFNRWSFQPIDFSSAFVYCFYDPTTGALRSIRQTLSAQKYCQNTSIERWIGPDLGNCDRTSFENPTAMMCPRSMPLSACPDGVVDGGTCSQYWTVCARADGSECGCRPYLTGNLDGGEWGCSGP